MLSVCASGAQRGQRRSYLDAITFARDVPVRPVVWTTPLNAVLPFGAIQLDRLAWLRADHLDVCTDSPQFLAQLVGGAGKIGKVP